MRENGKPKSPYVGLSPYTEHESAFFFGRELERDIIRDNLRANRLTLVYGGSGVGKSSILNAGVVSCLRDTTNYEREKGIAPKFAIGLMDTWNDDPIATFTKCLKDAVTQTLAVTEISPMPSTRDLAQQVEMWVTRTNLEFLIILDQFEEFFLYNENSIGAGTFTSEFPRLFNRLDLPVRFVVSVREDCLSMLDVFKKDLPDLYDNRYHISPLTIEAARRAIKEPLAAFNKLYTPDLPFEVDDALVEEVLDSVRSHKINLGNSGTSNTDVENRIYVEAPYLQLVMSRIWKEEVKLGSRRLRLDTLTNRDKLGGAKRVVEKHLDEVMNTLLTKSQRIVATHFIHYLVSRSGTKIALDASTLSSWSETPVKEIKTVLERLSLGDSRIIRQIDIGASPRENTNGSDATEKKYEIYHDALAEAIRSWRTRSLAEGESWKSLKKAIRVVSIPVLLLIITALFFSFDNYKKAAAAIRERDKAVYDKGQAEILKNAEIEKLTAFGEFAEEVAEYKSLVDILREIDTPQSRNTREIGVTRLKQRASRGLVPFELQHLFVDVVSRANMPQDLKQDVIIWLKKKIPPPPPPGTATKLPPRIFIQIQSEAQLHRAEEIQSKLLDRGYIVPGIEMVGSVKSVELPEAQLRYFSNDNNEDNIADEIVLVLKQNGMVAKKAFASRYKSILIKPKQFELWFPKSL